MEMNLLQRKKNLETKIPEIQKTLDVVIFLQSQVTNMINRCRKKDLL